MGDRLRWLVAFLVSAPACHVDDRGGGSTKDVLTVSTRDLVAGPPNAVGDVGKGVEWSIVAGTYGVASRTVADEHRAKKAQIASPSPAADNPSSARPTAETIAWAGDKNPAESVHLTLVLPEQSFSWDRFRGASESDRTSLIHERQAGLVTSQAAVISKLRALRNLSTRMRQRWFEFSESPRRRSAPALVG